MEIEVTKHARKRMKQRLGIKSEKEAIRMAKLALERGCAAEVEEREYLGVTDSRLLLRYQEGIYVFSKSLTLITVLPAHRVQKQNRMTMISSILLQEAKRAMAYA